MEKQASWRTITQDQQMAVSSSVVHEKVKVLEEGHTTKYLGRACRLDEPNEAEDPASISTTWRKSMAMRQVLCNRGRRLQHCLRVFEATISLTLLYGAGSWALDDERERQIWTTQRKLLRSMLAEGRRKAKG